MSGDVVYSVDGFLDKNRDTFFDDFKRLLFHSENPLISSMWSDGEKSIMSITKRPLTTATLFRNSMINLCNILSSKVTTNKIFDFVFQFKLESFTSSNHFMFAVSNLMMTNYQISSMLLEFNIKFCI